MRKKEILREKLHYEEQIEFESCMEKEVRAAERSLRKAKIGGDALGLGPKSLAG